MKSILPAFASFPLGGRLKLPQTTSAGRFMSSLACSLPDLLLNSKRLYLARHGETDWNRLGKMQGGGFDIPLNDNGIVQALALAQALKEIPLQIVASSHLSRASKTADVIFQEQQQKQRQRQRDHHHATDMVVQRIIESSFGEFRFGKFEGMALHGDQKDHDMKEEFNTVNEQIYSDINFSWPEGGEAVGDVDRRMRSALQSLVAGELGTSTGTTPTHFCIVGHGRANRVLLASLLRGDPLKHRDIEQGNTCINVLDVDEGGNWTAHLINYMEHTKRLQ